MLRRKTVCPSWLRALLANQAPPPKLFAWTPANLDTSSSPPTVPLGDRTALSPASLGGENSERSERSSNLERRIFILGVGNVGRLYASCLAAHPDTTPAPITLVVHRKELLSQWLQADGLRLTRHGETVASRAFDIEWWTEKRPEHGPVREVAHGAKIRSLFISTKAPVAMPEADRLRRYLDQSSTVVFAQNGMSKLWPPHGPLYLARRYQAGHAPSFSACVVNHGLLSTGPFSSTHTAPADAFIGPVLVDPLAPPTSDFFVGHISTAPRLETKPVSSSQLWLLQLEKLVMNAVINPLTALLRCKNGQLFQSSDPQEPLVSIINQLLAETSAVLQALVRHESSTHLVASHAKQHPDSYPDHGGTDLERLKAEMGGRFSQANLKSRLYAYGVKVGQNRSSMLQDVEAGKKTEIGDINGWIVDTAEFLDQGVDTPTHRRLIELVDKGLVLDEQGLAQQLLH